MINDDRYLLCAASSAGNEWEGPEFALLSSLAEVIVAFHIGRLTQFVIGATATLKEIQITIWKFLSSCGVRFVAVVM